MYWIQSEDSLRIGFKVKNRRLCPVGLFSHVYKRFHTSLHHVTHAVFIAIVDPSLINPGINGLQLQINLPKLRRCALFVCAEGALCKRSMISPHTWPWSSDARVCVAGNIQANYLSGSLDLGRAVWWFIVTWPTSQKAFLCKEGTYVHVPQTYVLLTFYTFYTFEKSTRTLRTSNVRSSNVPNGCANVRFWAGIGLHDLEESAQVDCRL